MGEPQRLSEVDGGSFPDFNPNLYDHFKATVEKYPDHLAVISRHQEPDLFPVVTNSSVQRPSTLRWTYSELWDFAGRLGHGLLQQGFPPERSLTVFLRNQVEWTLGFWTALRMGVTFVPFHPKLAESPLELHHELSIVKAGAIIAADIETASRLEKAESELLSEVKLKVLADFTEGDPSDWINLHSLLSSAEDGAGLTPHPQSQSEDHIAIFSFTGGTTSLPKPAPSKGALYVLGGLTAQTAYSFKPGRRLVAHLPSFHSYACLVNSAIWLSGACIVYPSPAYSPAATLDAIEFEQCTDMSGNPAMIDSLINHPTAAARNLNSLYEVNLGGSIVHPEILQKCKAPPLRAKYAVSGYGMTETGAVCSRDITMPQPVFQGNTNVGFAATGVKLRICFPDTRDLVPWGEVGELHIGNQYIYKNFPGRQEDWLYSEGKVNWVTTGDQARLGEDGEIYILGRYKDLIIRGGRNISPASIENVLNVLPGLEAVVVGIPDDIAGEVPVAVVKLSDDASYSDKDIRRTVIDSLGQHSAPQRVVKLRDLGLEHYPLTAANKIDRRHLTAAAKEFCEKPDAQVNGADSSNPEADLNRLRQTIASTWAELSAQSPEEIGNIMDFADSLLMLQATSLIEKRTQRSITLDEMRMNPTVQQQAELLSRRSGKTAVNSQAMSSRNGPPSIAEMAHVRHDEGQYKKTVEVAGAHLAKFNLTWQDVEDVLPAYDTGRFHYESAPRRRTSWNHRIAMVANVSAQNMRSSFVEALKAYAVFRSLVVKFDEDTWLQVIPRLSDTWIDQMIVIKDDQVGEADLPSYLSNDPKLDHAERGGPLLRATLVPLKESGSTGIILNMNHGTYDALSMSIFMDDLNLCVMGNAHKRPARVPYNIFADAFFLGRNGVVAQSLCRFFVEKLQGCGADKRAQWPSQKSKGWNWGKLYDWIDKDGKKLDPSIRTYVDPENDRYGMTGLGKKVQVSDDLNHQHGISMVAVFKTAVAMFNIHTTNADYAIFSHWEAGRTLPYLEDNAAYQAILPNAMDITGAMGQRVVDKITISSHETILDVLKGIQDDITLTTRNAHAPLYSIKQGLYTNAKSPTAAQDAEFFYDALQRQVFNWIPTLASSGTDPSKPLRQVQIFSRADIGFVWLASRVDRNTVYLNVRWDDAHLGWREADNAKDTVIACALWMLEPKNWGKTVADWWKEFGDAK